MKFTGFPAVDFIHDEDDSTANFHVPHVEYDHQDKESMKLEFKEVGCAAKPAHEMEASLSAKMDTGTLIVSAGGDGTVRTWDVNGNALQDLPGEKDSEVTHSAVITGTKVVATSQDTVNGGGVRMVIWDVESGQQLYDLSEFQTEPVTCLTVHPETQQIVSGGGSGRVRVWDHTGRCVRLMEGHTNQVSHVVVHKTNNDKGTIIISSSYDKTIKLWDSRGVCLRTLGRTGGQSGDGASSTASRLAHTKGVLTFAVQSSPGRLVSIQSCNTGLLMWTLSKDSSSRKPQKVEEHLSGEVGELTCVACTNNSKEDQYVHSRCCWISFAVALMPPPPLPFPLL